MILLKWNSFLFNLIFFICQKLIFTLTCLRDLNGFRSYWLTLIWAFNAKFFIFISKYFIILCINRKWFLSWNCHTRSWIRWFTIWTIFKLTFYNRAILIIWIIKESIPIITYQFWRWFRIIWKSWWFKSIRFVRQQFIFTFTFLRNFDLFWLDCLVLIWALNTNQFIFKTKHRLFDIHLKWRTTINWYIWSNIVNWAILSTL